MRLRIKWLDIAKGITIVLMVLGHSSIPRVASDFIFAFHMPLFFIASGLTTKFDGCGYKYFIINKVRKLMFPFLIYSAIVLCLRFFLLPEDPQSFQIWLINGWQGYALWFIPVLFLASIISMLIICKTKGYLTTVCAVGIALSGMALSYLNINLVWTLSTVPYATALIIFGHLMKPYIRYIPSNSRIVLIVGFVITAVVSHFFRLDMAWNKITPLTILSVGAIAGTMMIFSFSNMVEKKTKCFSKLLMAIGRETYLILAFSQIIMMILIELTDWNSILRYTVLVALFVVLKYMKDASLQALRRLDWPLKRP